jgi:hypothetical protein
MEAKYNYVSFYIIPAFHHSKNPEMPCSKKTAF